MTRREAREQALSMIFEMNFNDNSVDEMVDNALIFRDESVDEYAVQIAQQVRLHWEDNLSAVEQYSKKWKANRLPKVSLAILMLAITEIAYVKDAPVGGGQVPAQSQRDAGVLVACDMCFHCIVPLFQRINQNTL